MHFIPPVFITAGQKHQKMSILNYSNISNKNIINFKSLKAHQIYKYILLALYLCTFKFYSSYKSRTKLFIYKFLVDFTT